LAVQHRSTSFIFPYFRNAGEWLNGVLQQVLASALEITMTLAIGLDATPANQDQILFQPADRDAVLADLASIELEDADTFLAAMERARIKAAAYYFPHLLFSGSSKSRMLRWERHGESILLYQIRRQKGVSEMKLYCPPFPFDPAALRHAKQRVQDFNGSHSSHIIYVPEDEALRVMREGYAITLRSEEFIYDRAALIGLKGPLYGKVRQELSRSLRQGTVETRPYTPADQPACLAITESWRERLTANGMKISSSYGVTVACLNNANRFPSSLLTGLVVEVDGKLSGFGFSGPLTSTMGCNYVCITDVNFSGLTLLLRHRIMAEFPDLIYFNDADDAGRPELRSMKQRLHPVEIYGVYKATEQ
jgi:hypothetical protein